MDWWPILIAFLAGFLLALALAFVLRIIQAKTAKELAQELFQESEAARSATIEAVLENVKASFGKLSLEALSQSSDAFLKLAQVRLESEREVGVRELDTRKGLIDQQLQQMNSALEQVARLMKDLEMDRAQKFGELASQLKATGEQTAALLQSTQMLREALASTKVRGQWGERMAEDVLRLAGFREHVNYWKQRTIEGVGSRPDYTFRVPPDRELNMDVKFPLDNYLRFLEASSEEEKTRCRNAFLRDVRARIKEVTTRDYINPERNTIDCVLLFVPNEQVYSFIHEQDHSILDEGIQNKVIFCSPITLFAVLAVLRQAADQFSLTETSGEILSQLGGFQKQWVEFIRKLENLGKRIEEAHREYEALTTTRRRQLEKYLNRIEDLRMRRGLAIASGEEGQGKAETVVEAQE
ncbi:MAG: DNA recombination protein RmuC, partial [candidate division NC10 bacterium]|nr:DNA recombination protein RmuC [candidate division NC10 bacterium]